MATLLGTVLAFIASTIGVAGACEGLRICDPAVLHERPVSFHEGVFRIVARGQGMPETLHLVDGAGPVRGGEERLTTRWGACSHEIVRRVVLFVWTETPIPVGTLFFEVPLRAFGPSLPESTLASDSYGLRPATAPKRWQYERCHWRP